MDRDALFDQGVAQDFQMHIAQAFADLVVRDAFPDQFLLQQSQGLGVDCLEQLLCFGFRLVLNIPCPQLREELLELFFLVVCRRYPRDPQYPLFRPFFL